jgi:hypothetical protein
MIDVVYDMLMTIRNFMGGTVTVTRPPDRENCHLRGQTHTELEFPTDTAQNSPSSASVSP